MAEAAAVWGGVGACDSTAGEAMACFRAGTSLGSSVEVAISSRREVAASSLPGSSAIQHDATVNASLQIGQFYLLMSVVRLCMLFAAAIFVMYSPARSSNTPVEYCLNCNLKDSSEGVI